jgi:CRISPR/Cas system-associated exonuclease Cas4 (RecB family)
MPKIEEEPKIKNLLIQALEKKYAAERVGIHLTDLICPRLTFFRKTLDNSLTEKDIVFFLLGSGEGELIEQLVGDHNEIIVIKGGVVHTLDAFLLEGDTIVPVEIKTTRAEREDNVVRPHYLFQLGAYCSALNVSTGVLVVVMLNVGKVKVYRIFFDEKELQNIGEEVERRKNLLRKALESGDASVAPSVLNDPDLSWKCVSCNFRDMCKSIEEGWRFIDFVSPLDPNRGYAAKLRGVLEEERLKHGLEYELLLSEDKSVKGVKVRGKVEHVDHVRRFCEWVNEKLLERTAEVPFLEDV